MQIETKTTRVHFKLFICLFLIFILGCTGSFIAAWGLSLVAATTTTCCGSQASHRCDISCCRAQVLGSQASIVEAHGPLLCGMWNLLGPGIEPVSLALAGRFLSTVLLPRKSKDVIFTCYNGRGGGGKAG